MSEFATIAMLLRQVDLFSSVDPDDLETLCHSVQTINFKDGDHIFMEGDVGDSIYVIQHGVVKIVTLRNAEEHLIASCFPGDIVGELALLDGRPRSATAVASGVTSLLMISRDEFLNFLLGRPKVMLALLDTLTMRARRLSGIVETNIEFLGKVARGDFEHATGFALKLAPAMFKVAPTRALVRGSALSKTDQSPEAAMTRGGLFFAASAMINARSVDAGPAPDVPDEGP